MNKLIKRILLITVIVITLPLTSSLATPDMKTSIPEASTLLLLGCGIFGLGIFLLWKSKKGKDI